MTVRPVERSQTASVRRVLAGLQEAVDEAADLSLTAADDEEIAWALAEVARIESRVSAVKLAVLAEADRREIAERAVATGTDAWAAALVGSTRSVMAGGLWLADLLDRKYAATRVAFAAGQIGVDQARVIVRATEGLPAGVSPEQRRLAEERLVAEAVEGLDPRRLRIAARRMLQVVSMELADAHEAALLVAEERRAEDETWLTLGDNGNGTWTGKFVVSELHGQLLRTALERLTSPRRLGRDRTGRPVVDASVDGGDGTDAGLSWPEKLGAGLCELIEHLPHTGHGPVAATVVVHLDHRHLLDQLAAARIDTGTSISVGQARRLACGAGIVPLVLGGRSVALDLGRTARLHDRHQRLALSARHDTCAVTGCERPYAWCEIHHVKPWSLGGTTDLANALPLCGYHHRRAHDDRLTLRVLPTGEARFHRRR